MSTKTWHKVLGELRSMTPAIATLAENQELAVKTVDGELP
jgi:hypothetical protein